MSFFERDGLPPTISMILAEIAIGLTIVGFAFGFPILNKLGVIAGVAAMISFIATSIVGLLEVAHKSSKPDASLLTYLRGFFSDWLTIMSGPLSVPFAVALALWSSQREQKIIWGSLAVIATMYSSYRVWRKERLSFYERMKTVENKPEVSRPPLSERIASVSSIEK